MQISYPAHPQNLSPPTRIERRARLVLALAPRSCCLTKSFSGSSLTSGRSQHVKSARRAVRSNMTSRLAFPHQISSPPRSKVVWPRGIGVGDFLVMSGRWSPTVRSLGLNAAIVTDPGFERRFWPPKPQKSLLADRDLAVENPCRGNGFLDAETECYNRAERPQCSPETEIRNDPTKNPHRNRPDSSPGAGGFAVWVGLGVGRDRDRTLTPSIVQRGASPAELRAAEPSLTVWGPYSRLQIGQSGFWPWLGQRIRPAASCSLR